MSFEVAADAYERFMGGYADALARVFLQRLDVREGLTALDVGAGTGALTAPLAAALGASRVAAVEPSASFVTALAARVPGADVRRGAAESLAFADGAFDLVAAQLVVHFMTDAVAGLREMARVTAPGGTVAATVWDFAGDRAPLSAFWTAVRSVDDSAVDESHLPGAREGSLERLFEAAGLTEVQGSALAVELPYRDFAHWWEPYELGVGPAGAYLAGVSAAARHRVREACRALVGDDPGVVRAVAWCAIAPV